MPRNDHEINPYFAMQHGRRVQMSEIEKRAPYTMAAVETLVNSGEVVGQYMLPNPDTGRQDMQMWMPDKVDKRQQELEVKLSMVRAELDAMQKGEVFNAGETYKTLTLGHEKKNGRTHAFMEEGTWYKIGVEA